MEEGINRIEEKVSAFTRKYYLNILIRGSLLTLSIVLAYFLLAALVEHSLWLSRTGRSFIFFSFFLVVGYAIYRFLREPLAWWVYKRGLNQEDSARIIGKFFPEVSDKLLNLIQLATVSKRTPLISAGILQKTNSLQNISFEHAIDLKENRRYLKYLLFPLAMILILMVINLGIFTQSTRRIVQFNQDFSPEAPFVFKLQNENLLAFFNEDFVVELSLDGNTIPDAVYLVSGGQRWKMESQGEAQFAYTFDNLQNSVDFQFEAAGFFSPKHTIQLINRPELTQLKVALNYPSYLQLIAQELLNAGNLQIPEGTKVTWRIQAAHALKASILFSDGTENSMQITDNESFMFGQVFKNPDQYTLTLENENSKNKDRISYAIHVIKDQYPQIVVDNLRDSVLYKTILLGGNVSDDYGVTSLKLNYSISNGSKESGSKSIVIPLSGQEQQHNFFHSWSLDSLALQPGDRLTYYLQVWDNDGVNGKKSSRSASYTFSLPTEQEMKANISQSQQAAQSKMDESLQKAKDLRQSIDQAQQKLKGKQTLDWQDKRMLEDLILQKEKLENTIQNLQHENQMLEQKKESFNEENERIRQKSEQIQKLMNELLDEETKKMFEELERLLKENADMNQIQKILDKMDRKEINLEKELERTLELFKQLQYDYKVEQAIEELKQQTEQQKDLLNKTEELSKEEENKNKRNEKNEPEKRNEAAEELAKEQNKLNQEFDQLKEQLSEIQKLGEELDKNDPVPEEETQDAVDQAQEESQKSLEEKDSKKSTQKQKEAISKMQEMQQQMESMQGAMEMEMDMQNMESLRQIIHGLIKLSYDQETLIKDFGPIQQNDPKYVHLSQNQLKLKDDAKVLEDSLLALSKKDPFMGSIVTREVGELNDHIDKSVLNIKERRKANASTEMQLSMTSINNLALMLNDHFEMMMNMMANAKSGKGKKPGKPSLGKMQEQLNQQMEEIRKGGTQGRQLSEEYARMAAEQERIRRALEEMQERLKEQGGKIPGGDIPGKMEQTEMDLVNKQITEQTIQRQREILTRLLEAEKSMREQDLDEERKGEAAKDYSNEIPKAFEEYLRLKEKEVELLKTVPPKLYPYYKQEVGEYFKRIKTSE